jgi:hypothetical protein
MDSSARSDIFGRRCEGLNPASGTTSKPSRHSRSTEIGASPTPGSARNLLPRRCKPRAGSRIRSPLPPTASPRPTCFRCRVHWRRSINQRRTHELRVATRCRHGARAGGLGVRASAGRPDRPVRPGCNPTSSETLRPPRPAKAWGLPRDAGRKIVRTAWTSPTRQTGGPAGQVVGSEYPKQGLVPCEFAHPRQSTLVPDAPPPRMRGRRIRIPDLIGDVFHPTPKLSCATGWTWAVPPSVAYLGRAYVIQDCLPDCFVCAATVDRGRRIHAWAESRAGTKHAASTLKHGCETSRVGGPTEIQVKERTDRVDDNARHTRPRSRRGFCQAVGLLCCGQGSPHCIARCGLHRGIADHHGSHGR